MNIYKLLLFSLIITTGINLHAQVNILNAINPEDIGIDNQSEAEKENDRLLEYSYVDDRDIFWSKTVWETIDLDAKANLPLYYPTDTINIGPDRRSLFDVLMKNLRKGNIKKIYADSYFNEEITYEDVLSTLSKTDTLDYGFEQLNAGEEISPEYIVTTKIESIDIEQYRIKGLWYFDKRYSALKYRILGAAPVSKDVNFKNDNTQPLVELFWVWYPDIRTPLHRAKIFNSSNSAEFISFDKALTTRRFSGVIYKSDNIYDDRKIQDYIKENAYLQLIEAQRIKEEIRNREEDMWNY